MNLANVLSTANSSLAAIAGQSAVISRNVAGVNDPTYSRKSANVITIAGGGAQTVSVSRTTNSALFDAMLNATSGSASQDALVNGLNQLDQVATSAQSPSTMISNLTNSIQQYSANPADTSLAQGVLTSAKAAVSALNTATNNVQQIRAQADAGIATSVSNINNLLAQFKTVNTTIVSAAQSGADVTDAMDQRDSILSQLSKEIGITTVTRANNDTVIYTDSGVTLFETNARSVSFQPTNTFTPTTSGNAVKVDGVPITGASSTMPIKSGQLAGLTTLRDNVAVTYQNAGSSTHSLKATKAIPRVCPTCRAYSPTLAHRRCPAIRSLKGWRQTSKSIPMPIRAKAVIWPCCAMAAFPTHLTPPTTRRGAPLLPEDSKIFSPNCPNPKASIPRPMLGHRIR
jgi:flagellar hook-associated protein 1 FlgK